MKDGIGFQEVKDFYNNYINQLSYGTGRNKHVIESLNKIISRDMTVLDVGCGTGITTEAISKLASYVVGIDIAEVLIARARERVKADFIVGDFCNISLRKKFNIVCLIDVMEHILPSSIWDFIKSVKFHAEDYVYLNIPDSRFIKYIRKIKPTILQLVDEPYDIGYILWLFEWADFTPLHIFFYGEKGLPQYNEFLFVKRGKLKYERRADS